MENIKQFVVTNLKEQNGNLRVIAEETGVPYSSLLKIASGEIKNPGIDHIQVLLLYFRKPTCLDVGGTKPNDKRTGVPRRKDRREFE
jgi:predicted transcriptional regulator